MGLKSESISIRFRKRGSPATAVAHGESCEDRAESAAEFELESATDSSESESESETPVEVMVEPPPRRSYPSRSRRPPARLEPTY